MMIFGIFWEGLTWAWDFFSWGWVFTTCHPGGGLSKGHLIRGGPSHPPPHSQHAYSIRPLGNSDFPQKCFISTQMVQLLSVYLSGGDFRRFWRFSE